MAYNQISDCHYLQAVPSSALPTGKITATKRNVTFHPTCTVRTHICGSITDDEKLASYYNKDELRAMKREAVNGLLCTMSSDSIRSNDVTVGANHPAPDTHRGLELILQPQRRKNRELVRQSILKYQMLLNSVSDLTGEQRQLRLAHISAKLNRWTTHEAFQTAWRDACEAVDFFHDTSFCFCSFPNKARPISATALSTFAETDMESFPICCMEH